MWGCGRKYDGRFFVQQKVQWLGNLYIILGQQIELICIFVHYKKLYNAMLTFIDNEEFHELNVVLKQLADKYHVSKNAIAVAWILKHPAKMQVLLGTMNPQHIIDSAQGSEITLTNQEWYDIYLAAGNSLP